jgi:hypothetical protein
MDHEEEVMDHEEEVMDHEGEVMDQGVLWDGKLPSTY